MSRGKDVSFDTAQQVTSWIELTPEMACRQRRGLGGPGVEYPYLGKIGVNRRSTAPPPSSPEGRYSCRTAHIGASEAGFLNTIRGDSYRFRFRLRAGKSAFARESGIGNNSSNHS